MFDEKLNEINKVNRKTQKPCDLVWYPGFFVFILCVSLCQAIVFRGVLVTISFEKVP